MQAAPTACSSSSTLLLTQPNLTATAEAKPHALSCNQQAVKAKPTTAVTTGLHPVALAQI